VLAALAALPGVSAVPQALSAADDDAPERTPERTPADLNAEVIEEAERHAGGGYNNRWAGSGTMQEIRFKGERILAAGQGGTYCCGYTFNVFMNVAQQHRLLDDLTVDQVRALQKHWYGSVPDSHDQAELIRETQIRYALTLLGLGTGVEPEDARPGDFLQFWRQRSGHSVVFLGWVREDGEVVGLRYRSSQGATDGIGEHTERFADHGGSVDPQRMYFARLHAPAED
jgi:hypothetical protein